MTQNLSITTFRYLPIVEESNNQINQAYLNTLNETLLDALQESGELFLSNAIINDKYCLRGCVVNFRTSKKDIEEIVEIIVREGRNIHKRLQIS